MACPYFVPEAPLHDSQWLHAPRMPLGATFQGYCAAPPVMEPLTEDRLRDHCNCGYARALCSRFPKDAEADAVRFHIASQTEAAIHVIWITEKDHAPFAHGVLVFLIGENRWQSLPPTDLLTRQAQAFLAAHHSHRRAAAP